MKKRIITILLIVLCFSLFFYLSCIEAGLPGYPHCFSSLTGDYMWNFHMIQKIYNGWIPYSDINMISTPFFHFLGSFFLKIFGNNFLSYNIYSAIIATFIIFISFKIIHLLTDSNKVSFVTSSIVFFFVFMDYNPNYNYLFTLIMLIVVLLEMLKNKSIYSSKYHYIFIGLLMGLGLWTKQNLALIFGFGFFIYILITEKSKLLSLTKVAIGASLVSLPFLFYILANNILTDFIDLAFGSMNDFVNNSRLVKSGVIALLIVSIIGVIYCVSTTIKKRYRIVLLASIFSICSFIYIYPIVDLNHYSAGAVFVILPLSYLLYKKYCSINDRRRLLCKTITYSTISVLLLTTVASFGLLISYCDLDRTLPEKYKIYKYAWQVSDELIEDIDRINTYISEKEQNSKVILLSNDASLIFVPFNKNNNKYDLLLVGNLGKNGEQRIIEDIEKMHNVYIIDNKRFGQYCYQESKPIFDYVSSHFEVIDTIDNLNALEDKNVYYKK